MVSRIKVSNKCLFLFLTCCEDWCCIQIWRLVTHMTIVGSFSFGFLIKLIWIFTYGKTLESVVYEHHPEDYLFLYMFCTACFSVISLLLSPLVLNLFPMAISGPSMVMVLVYLWSKEYPEEVRLKLTDVADSEVFFKIKSFF